MKRLQLSQMVIGGAQCAPCGTEARSLPLGDAFLEAGAEGAVVSIPDETSLRDFAQRYR